jgi:hypothetical protein
MSGARDDPSNAASTHGERKRFTFARSTISRDRVDGFLE